MLTQLLTLADKPAISSPVLDKFMDVVNFISKPEFSLTILVVLFVLMLVFYRTWTKPAIAVALLVVFCVFYFGSMLISTDYLSIIKKPDNVPITMMLLGTALCLWMAFRQAAINDDNLRAGKPLLAEGKDDKTLVWPDLVYTELICLVLATAALTYWAILLRAPLESPANPAGPPNPSKAPWYFLGLQEMLVYFDPWIAGVLLPGMVVTGLLCMPYIDTNPKGNGYYTLRERRFAISTWLFGFIILWVVLIVYGTFLRGPNWNFFGPYQYWDATRQDPLTNINLSDYVWISGLHKPLPTPDVYGPMAAVVRESVGIVFILFWLFVLPVVLARTFLSRMREQMGFMRFYIMAFHLVVMGLLPLKMVLRWTLTLKYFVYLPEINMNI